MARKTILFTALAFLAVDGMQKDIAMAEDKSPVLIAAEEAKGIAEAEKDRAESLLAKAEAERKLANVDAMQRAAIDKALADAQAAAFGKQEAASKAQVAAIAAQQAETKAQFGSVASNSVSTPTVVVGANAGTAEAGLLTAKALGTIGGAISKEITRDGPVVIFTGTQKPSFANWRLFELKREMIEMSFDQVELQSNAADGAFAKLKLPEPPKLDGGVEALGVGTAITAAGAILDSVAKLGSFFQTNYDFAALSVVSDDDLLAVSVAKGLGGKAYLPARWSAADDGAGILTLLDKSRKARITSAGRLANSQERLALLASALKSAKTDAEKQPIQNVIEAYQKAVAAHQFVQKMFDDFFASLSVAEQGQPPLIAKIYDEKFASDKIAAGASVLLLHVHVAAGGSYSKKNIWTFFGGLPFSVMGGSVASYVLFDKDGKLLLANQFQQHGGYHKVNKVQAALEKP